jgi:3-deoxy-manno-octulosonate cytidylyltransferase (CMP-KDO synthetase)
VANNSLKDWLVVVPARLGSTRLAEKPLQELGGKPLVVKVFENIRGLAAFGAEMWVATDSERVVKACAEHHVPTKMTREDHASGTDRCYEVAEGTKHPYVLNVQGDEPSVNAEDLKTLMDALAKDSVSDIATPVYPSTNLADFQNPNTVKAIPDKDMRALYFTRAMAPFPRDNPSQISFWHHLGVYAFKKAALARFCALAPGKLEQLEKLEQLRALENGMKILLVPAKQLSVGIDTFEQLKEAREKFR